MMDRAENAEELTSSLGRQDEFEGLLDLALGPSHVGQMLRSDGVLEDLSLGGERLVVREFGAGPTTRDLDQVGLTNSCRDGEREPRHNLCDARALGGPQGQCAMGQECGRLVVAPETMNERLCPS